MKRLFFLISFLIYVGCKCIIPQHVPPQLLKAGPDCQAELPNYLEFFTVRDNCPGTILTQVPSAGAILSPANPYIQVKIIAIDLSGNTDTVLFDAILWDDIPPVIEIDTVFLTLGPEKWSALTTAYHNSIGQAIDRACQDNPGGMWCDSTFYKKLMLSITSPGYSGITWGTFFSSKQTVMVLDSGQMAKLGIYIDPEPYYVNSGGDGDKFYQQFKGGQYTNDTLNLGPPYNSERFGNFEYNIPTGPGFFNVNLYFTEIFWQDPGRRVFDVEIEGKILITDLDIFDEIGFGRVLGRSFQIEAIGESLDINFISKTDYAKVSAIIVSKSHSVLANK